MLSSSDTQAPTAPINAVVRRFFGREVTVWKADDWSPFPWRFSVRDTTGVLHEYAGIPNKCETAHAALMRGWYRAKWMHDGTYQERYRPTG